jgi:hypothetical protein
LFNGNLTIAGLLMFSFIIGVLFALVKNVTAVLLITLPIILVFSSLGILSGDMIIILIIITVLGLAMSARGVLSG